MLYEYVCTNDLYYDKNMFDIMLYDIKNTDVQIMYKNICMPITLKEKVFGNRVQRRHPWISRGACKLCFHELDGELRKRTSTDEIHILFYNVSIKYYSISRIKNYRKRFHNIRIDLLFIDSEKLSSSNAGYYMLKKCQSLFDNVYSVSKIDAEKHNAIKVNTPYSFVPEYADFANQSVNYDIYWGGTLKGRDELIRSLIVEFKKESIDYLIDAYTWADEQKEIIWIGMAKSKNEFLPYGSMLKKTLLANVILDVVKESMPITLRTYEAVVYNKKLLTNNKEILNFHYYDGVNIRYFEKMDDIDFSWIKDRKRPNYNYNNEFSITSILKTYKKDAAG